MKFLITGLGSIGQRHYRNLFALGERNIVVYRTGRGSNKKFIAAFIKEFRPKIFYDFSEALAYKPDAVIITNPTALHVRLARQAMASGAHVFTEKPFSHSLAGTQSLIDLAKKKKLVGYVGYNLRFHPLLRKMKHWFDSGAIGKPVSARAEIGEYLPDWHPWENYRKTYAAREDLGGGVVLTQSHDIDYLYWFFGKAERVAAFGGTKSDLGIDADDMAEAIIEFRSGVVASLGMNYLARPPKRQFEILGTQGRMLWDYHGKILKLAPFKQNAAPRIVHEPKNFERNTMFIEELKHFIRCAEGKDKPLVDLADGMESLKIALAVKGSIKKGKIINV